MAIVHKILFHSALVISLALLGNTAPISVFAQTNCQPGEKLSTEADIPDMGQLPKELQKAGVCWDPLGVVGKDANAAKAYLKSLPRQTN